LKIDNLDYVPLLNWKNFMHAYYLEVEKNEDIIVKQISKLSEEEMIFSK